MSFWKEKNIKNVAELKEFGNTRGRARSQTEENRGRRPDERWQRSNVAIGTLSAGGGGKIKVCLFLYVQYVRIGHHICSLSSLSIAYLDGAVRWNGTKVLLERASEQDSHSLASSWTTFNRRPLNTNQLLTSGRVIWPEGIQFGDKLYSGATETEQNQQDEGPWRGGGGWNKFKYNQQTLQYGHLFNYCLLMVLSNRPITWQQLGAFRRVGMVERSCWSSKRASEWGRQLSQMTLNTACSDEPGCAAATFRWCDWPIR